MKISNSRSHKNLTRSFNVDHATRLQTHILQFVSDYTYMMMPQYGIHNDTYNADEYNKKPPSLQKLQTATYCNYHYLQHHKPPASDHHRIWCFSSSQFSFYKTYTQTYSTQYRFFCFPFERLTRFTYLSIDLSFCEICAAIERHTTESIEPT